MEEEINILKHNLTPKHTKLTEQEKKDLLEHYNISITQLPQVTISDPAIKELKPQIGDVIKIVRASPTANQTIFYRAVTHD
mgnify:CR=1 FL=1